MTYGIQTTCRIEGLTELERNLASLGQRVHNRVQRQAVNAAMRPILKEARARAPRDSGALAKSLIVKVRTYQGNVFAAFLGPEANKVYWIHRRSRRGNYASIRLHKHVPSNIAHLVEMGHRMVVGGKVARVGAMTNPSKHKGRVIGFVAARPFLVPSMESQIAAATQAYADKMAQGIAREVEKRGVA